MQLNFNIKKTTKFAVRANNPVWALNSLEEMGELQMYVFEEFRQAVLMHETIIFPMLVHGHYTVFVSWNLNGVQNYLEINHQYL